MSLLKTLSKPDAIATLPKSLRILIFVHKDSGLKPL